MLPASETVFIEEIEVSCPYCGETITLLIDGSAPEQTYIEDCEVCCRPIVVSYVWLDGEPVEVQVRCEDD